ncbi:MAG TPA: DUF2065 domain-containing protein [Syntrophales bacterium]|nr:DUF2065 domain-containing protein [Syntrophales bacterium]
MELFLSALGLVFVLEGLPYFAFPEKMKGYLLRIAEIPEGQLRVFGFLSVIGGLALVYVTRQG